jgi:anthranilate/para-aminobenzoate synthase component I
VALAPERVIRWRRVRDGRDEAPLAALERLVRDRRRRGGEASTGVAALLGFDLLAPAGGGRDDGSSLPDLVALTVDSSVCFAPGARPVLHGRTDREIERARRRLRILRETSGPSSDRARPSRVVPESARPATSLPRDDYLRAVEVVKEHIRAGDIYQANLTQRFTIDYRGDPFELFRDLCRAAPGPRSAFVGLEELAVGSVSPETFLRATPDGRVETRPIKGTRPRADDPDEDAALARSLVDSAKDRAELLMVVDLERNDLGRVCRTGSIEVPELLTLRSYAAVHHLVARVTGDLLPETGPAGLIESTFPGGSVSGVPKTRALEILRRLEPVPRNFYTGSLLWFGDDGSLESSILIRTVVLSGGRAMLGAGGAVVADSDPEEEWVESNHKAARLARVLGFAPEEAS